MSYKVMDWKSKLFDELVSRFTFLATMCIVPLFFVQLTPENERAYIVVTGLVLGGGLGKTIMNGVKAVKNGEAKKEK